MKNWLPITCFHVHPLDQFHGRRKCKFLEPKLHTELIGVDNRIRALVSYACLEFYLNFSGYKRLCSNESKSLAEARLYCTEISLFVFASLVSILPLNCQHHWIGMFRRRRDASSNVPHVIFLPKLLLDDYLPF